MKGAINISDYFYGAKTLFIIHLYQRRICLAAEALCTFI